MIKEQKGNILFAEEQIIVQQVNCKGFMGKGLAEQIRQKYPTVYVEYKKRVELYLKKKKESLLLGTIQFVKVEEDKWICNIFSQHNIGYNQRYTKYEALKEGFMRLKEVAERRNKSIAIPKYIGCGLGGGDWVEVYDIIVEVFKNHEVKLYDYDN